MTQQPEPEDTCRPVNVDGETIRVRGQGELTPEGEQALTVLVRAAKAKLVAEAPEQVGLLQNRLRLAHRARRGKEHQLDDVRRALCDIGFMDDDDPYSHADLAEVIRQNGAALREVGEADGADAADLAAQRERDQLATVLAEVLRHFTERGYPGAPCVRTGWVRADTVDRWRSVVQHDVGRPWWQQLDTVRAELEQAQAAIDRVRAIKRAPQRSHFNTLANAQDNGWDAALHAVFAALDRTEQPHTTKE